ncbi:MAG: NADH-quinone oxidoreductase subunit J [Candidatus Neomarinimicrobiota bacterium]
MGESVFIALAAFVVVTAYFTVTSPNLVHAAVALMGTLFGVAGLYIFLYADFLAAVQIVIYVGGILVLIIFGVMLTTQIGSQVLLKSALPNRLAAALVIAVMFAGLATIMLRTPWRLGELEAVEGTVSTIGTALLTRYLLHFEVAGVLLLLALLGAVYLARRENE